MVQAKTQKERLRHKIGKNINIQHNSLINKMTNKLKTIIARESYA